MRMRAKMATAGLVVGAALAGGTAYSFWSTGGGGSGTGATSAEVAEVALSGDLTTPLYPGLTTAVTVSALNTNPGEIRLGAVYATAAFATDELDALCPLSVTSLTGPFDLAGGATAPVALGEVSITFTNTEEDQTACVGQPITLRYTTVAPTS